MNIKSSNDTSTKPKPLPLIPPESKSPGSIISNYLDSIFSNDGTAKFFNFPAKLYGKSMSSGVLGSTIANSVLGAGAGALINTILNLKNRSKGGYLPSLLAGAGAGAGLGYLSSAPAYSYTKKSSLSVEGAIYSDPSIDYNTKQHLVQNVGKLGISDYSDLHRIVSASKSAIVSGIIAKFLFNRGIKTSLIVALAVGVSSILFGGPAPTDNSLDFFGRKRLF